jgi:hypothetical protein
MSIKIVLPTTEMLHKNLSAKTVHQPLLICQSKKKNHKKATIPYSLETREFGNCLPLPRVLSAHLKPQQTSYIRTVVPTGLWSSCAVTPRQLLIEACFWGGDGPVGIWFTPVVCKCVGAALEMGGVRCNSRYRNNRVSQGRSYWGLVTFLCSRRH